MEQFIQRVLQLTKARMGISSHIRDEYLEMIIRGIVDELTTVQKITLREDSDAHIMFVVDFADWRYHNRTTIEQMPRHLQFRLHNLIMSRVRE